jgi:hypothetical protein
VVGVRSVAKAEHEAQEYRRYKSAVSQVQLVILVGYTGTASWRALRPM